MKLVLKRWSEFDREDALWVGFLGGMLVGILVALVIGA